jgi:glycosyltransferase involved in cell wall biosynthesis
MPRLAIVNTHPIQYYTPYYRQLDNRCGLDVKVFYSWRGFVEEAYDPGFEQEVSWDIPLLEGYDYTFVENKAADSGTHHFRGIVTPDLIPEVEEWGPDVVLVFGWNYQAHLRALHYFHGRVPVLFRGDSTLLDESSGPRKWARRLWLRWVYRHVNASLYVGQNNKDYFEAHGLEEDDLFWVPHAVDTTRFAEMDGADHEAAHWRREISIPNEAPVVLFAGKLEPKKAPDILLKAFMKLGSSTAHLVVVGSGAMEEKLRYRAGDHSRVHFIGFQNQSRMPVVYRLGDVFVLPSRGPGETWGLAVNEAMACGCAVVVSDKVGCAPDLVDEKNGAVVPAENVKALRHALGDLLEDPERPERMGHQSRERIADWSVETAVEQTAEAVRSVLEGGQ